MIANETLGYFVARIQTFLIQVCIYLVIVTFVTLLLLKWFVRVTLKQSVMHNIGQRERFIWSANSQAF